MAMIVRYRGQNVDGLHNEIRAKCSISMQRGFEYPYNHDTKTIEHRESGDGITKVYSLVAISETEIIVILPYEIARTLDATRPQGTNCPKQDEVCANFAGTLREYQTDDTERIISMLRKTGRCYMQAPPGYGKTVIISYVISVLKERTLIVVPTCPLADQTKVSIEEMLPGLRVHILETNRIVPEDADVVVCFLRRLNGTSAPFTCFKTVVFDEVHMLSTTQGIAAMLTTRPQHLLAVTATGGDRHKITELFVGKCEIKSLGQKRWSIAFPRIRSGLDGTKYSGVEGYTEAITDLSSSTPFIWSVARMVKYFVHMDRRVIVITMRKEMCDNLSNLLPCASVLCPGNEQCGNCDVIIGTHKFIGTGFDLRNHVKDFDGKCASVMIFLGSIKNPTLMYQASGRAFRSRDSLAIYPTIPELPVSVNHARDLLSEAKRSDGCVILNDYARFLEQFNEPHPTIT